MRIESIQLKNYIPFQFSNIHELRVNFVSNTIVVIGTNGSGKSALFRMLNPLPPVRTDFSKEGYKELHISHHTNKYILISDFSNKTSPHSFILNNIELNLGGTSGIQEELVEKHFGYTSLDNKLFRMEIDFCRLGKAERKNLFLALCPVDLTLVLDIHKRSLSKIKECKNNLTHLYTRKEEIEGKLIDISILEETKKHKIKLEEQKNILDKLIYTLEQHNKQIATNNHITPDYIPDTEFIKENRSFLKKIRTFFPHFHFINRETYLEDYNQNNANLVMTIDNIESIKKQIHEVSNEIKEYQLHLEKNNKKPISIMENEIQDMNKLIEEINKNTISNPGVILEKYQEDEFLRYVEDLKPKIEFLQNKLSTVKLWSNKILQLIEQKLDKFVFTIKMLNEKKQDIDKDIHRYNLEKNKFKLHIPKECKFNDCGLKEKYLDKQNTVCSEIIELEQKANAVQTKIDYHSNLYKKLYKIYEDRKPYTQVAYEINDIWTSTSLLSGIHLKYRLSYYLNHLPAQLLRILNMIFENSKEIRRLNQLTLKRDTLQQEVNALIKANSVSKEFIENMLNDKITKLNLFISELNKLIDKKDNYQDNNRLYKQFIEVKETIKGQTDQFYQQANKYVAYKHIEYYQNIIRTCENMKNEIDHELRNIDITIKEQDNLYARYQEEIVKQIKHIELTKVKYQAIEKELSPNSGLPHKYLVEFLNIMIHNANYFIAQVFNYPLKLSKINPLLPIDFSLEVSAKHVKIRDISLLSKGQTEMVNLSLTLAILLQKKMLNQYPLFLDEVGGSFDPTHQLSLLELFKSLQDRKLIDQMFMINHHAIYSQGFSDADVIALLPDDSVLTNNINEHVDIL